MESLALKRVQNQKKQIQQNPPTFWKIIPHPQKWSLWDVWITTQLSTPYHSKPFKLIVEFPENYPYGLPTLRLENHQRFFHPNISASTGYICQQTLKSTKACMTIRERIDAFIHLLQVPNPSNPNNATAAAMYNQCQRKFYRKAFNVFRGYEKMP